MHKRQRKRDRIFIREQRSLDDVIGGYIGFNDHDIGSSLTSEAQSVMDILLHGVLIFLTMTLSFVPAFGF